MPKLKLIRLVIVLAGALAGLAFYAAPAFAECVNQTNFFPPFSRVAPTADRVVIGTVGPNMHGHEVSPWFDLHVTSVLRGSSASDLEIKGLPSGLALNGAPACRADAIVYVRSGDMIALAFGGHLPGVNGKVTTVAWIKGAPDELFMQHVETLTTDEVRRLASLPDTGVSANQAGLPSPDRSLLLLAAALGLAAGIGLLRRRGATSGNPHGS